MRSLTLFALFIVIKGFSLAFAALLTNNLLIAYGIKPDAADHDEPWYGISTYTRICTAIGDTIDICLMTVLGVLYQRTITAKRGSAEYIKAADRDLANEASLTTSLGVPGFIFLQQEESIPGHLPGSDLDGSKANPSSFGSWARRAIWSAAAWPLRMGDTFYAAGVFRSPWFPLQLYTLGRICALGVGWLPHMYTGVPSLVAQLMQGVVFAGVRYKLEQNVRLLKYVSKNYDSYLLSLVNGVGGAAASADSCSESWAYHSRNVLGYSFCCCFMAMDDAEVVDSIEKVEMHGILDVVVGAPIRMVE
jgi:hypothetical protein